MKTSIVWFRNDLRLRDNVTLATAIRDSDFIVPVYIIDDQRWRDLDAGFKKTGPFQTKFILQAITDLKSQLQKRGSDLLVKRGDPAKEIAALARAYNANHVYATQEVTGEETQQEETLNQNLAESGKELHLYWQSTLFHVDDLVMPVSELPDVFTSFRKKNEKYATIRPEVETPLQITSPEIEATKIPKLTYFGYSEMDAKQDQRRALELKGGEQEAWHRLNRYFWESDQLKNYKWMRNGLLGEDYSSKFSPWLAHGCLSPRSIYHEVKRYEEERKKNISTYWLIFELIWRDYFRYVCQKYGHNVFLPGGIKGQPLDTSANKEKYESWRKGETGQPFVDANMKELFYTGFMSNRGRQNVASYLVKDLGVHWWWGAAWFESQLIDYDVCSNWGNWMYVAGVGNDPRENRYFNVASQAEKYDGKGDYMRHWLEPNLFS